MAFADAVGDNSRVVQKSRLRMGATSVRGESRRTFCAAFPAVPPGPWPACCCGMVPGWGMR